MTTTTFKNILSAGLVGVCLMGGFSAAPVLADDRINSAAQVQTYGAKKSIAVAKFDANGAFLNSYGGWDVGGGLSAIMASELDNTGAFRVVNRSDLDAALYEQSLALQGLTAANTVKAGQLIGAQYLVRGSVTEFSNAKKGGGLSVGGNVGKMFGGLSPQRRKGHIGIDVSVIDSTTGAIVASTTVRKEVKKWAVAGNLTGDGWSVGGNKFENSELGEVAREAIQEAVVQLASALSGQAWTAQVAQVSGSTLFVNAGHTSGLRIGDTMLIKRVAEKIIDPVTGAVLGVEEVTVGTATISEVKDQYAKATFVGSQAPRIGDTLSLNASVALAQR